MVRRPARYFAVTVASVLILDQVSKALVRSSLAAGESVAVIGTVLSFTHVRNTGAAFGIFQGGTPFFIATSVAVLAVIAWVWWRLRPANVWVVSALGLVSAGAAGNLIDRAVNGHVTDFIDVHVWPVFNVADVALDVGVGILVVWLLFSKEAEGVSDPDAPAERPVRAGGDSAP
ncbi:MAG: signal peptidase II [Coriobacteriales bacterium]